MDAVSAQAPASELPAQSSSPPAADAPPAVSSAPGHEMSPDDPRLQRCGFAKLQGPDVEFFMRKYEIILGRHSNSAGADVVLGNNMNLSRKHASISYNFDKGVFELKVLGKNGVTVDGVLYTPASPAITLVSQVQLGMGDRTFHFLLPKLPSKPKPPRSRAKPKPAAQPAGDAATTAAAGNGSDTAAAASDAPAAPQGSKHSPQPPPAEPMEVDTQPPAVSAAAAHQQGSWPMAGPAGAMMPTLQQQQLAAAMAQRQQPPPRVQAASQPPFAGPTVTGGYGPMTGLGGGAASTPQAAQPGACGAPQGGRATPAQAYDTLTAGLGGARPPPQHPQQQPPPPPQ